MGSPLQRLIARLGMSGLIIVAAALIFGVLAGGVVVHRLETSPAAQEQQQQQQGQQQGEVSDQSDQENQQPKAKATPKRDRPASSPRTTEPETD
jgi:Na+/glutamate symporter